MSEDKADKDRTQVVVIAGGRAKRLGIDIPKCLLEISGRRLIDICLDMLAGQGFSNFVLLLGHQSDMVISYLDARKKSEIKITYSIDPPSIEGWGKGKAFKHALLNGSIDRSRKSLVVFPDDLILDNRAHSRLLSNHVRLVAEHDIAASIMLVSEIELPYGIAEVGNDGIIRRFAEKPMVKHSTSVGVYIFEPEVHEIIQEKISLEDSSAVDLEASLFPSLVERGRLAGMHIAADQWLPVNTKKEYEVAAKRLAKTDLNHSSGVKV